MGNTKTKAAHWHNSDTEVHGNPGQRMGLDTPVVQGLNDVLLLSGVSTLSGRSKRVKEPPGKYGRRAKTQRNRRGLAQAVDYGLIRR